MPRQEPSRQLHSAIEQVVEWAVRENMSVRDFFSNVEDHWLAHISERRVQAREDFKILLERR